MHAAVLTRGRDLDIFLEEQPMTPVARAVLLKFAVEFRLSAAETRVLALAAVGMDTKNIAFELGCGRATIDTYWKRTFKKTRTGSQRSVMAALFRYSVKVLNVTDDMRDDAAPEPSAEESRAACP